MPTKIVGLLMTLALAGSNTGVKSAQTSLSGAQGLRIMRIAMSIEATGRGGYLDLRGVMKLATDPNSGYSASDLSTAVLLDSATATVQDYTLHILRADDGKHFQISLTPTTPANDSRLSWFTDDRGVIYTGKPIS